MRRVAALRRLMAGAACLTTAAGSSSVADVAAVLKNAGRVLVMTGAGLSTPSGIPDFRTPGSGIYDNLQKYSLPYPEAIFELEYFKTNPDPFNEFAKEIWPTGAKYRPNAGHMFIRLLHDKAALLRLYTQNIDGLEYLAGVPPEKIVPAHGSFTSAACTACGASADVAAMKATVLRGGTPRCGACGNFTKPDIVFFGEALPERYFTSLAADLGLGGVGSWIEKEHAVGGPVGPDALLCVGTSLVVQPFASIAEQVSYDVPRVLINREQVGSFGQRPDDYLLLGDLVDNVQALCDTLGWSAELQKLVHSAAQA